jgi:PE family
MDFVSANADLIGQASQDFATIRSGLEEAQAAWSGAATTVEPAARDEISAAIATAFSKVGQQFQDQSTRAMTFHNDVVNLMKTSATAYASSEVANGATLAAGLGAQTGDPLGQIGASVEAFLGSEFTVTGETVGVIGNTLVSGGETLSAAGQFLSAEADEALQILTQNSDIPLPFVGAFLGDVLAAAPSGLILQTAGSATQFLGGGLSQIGDDMFGFGISLAEDSGTLLF